MKKNSIANFILFIFKAIYYFIPSIILFIIINPWFMFTLTTIKMVLVLIASIFIFAHVYHAFDINNYDTSKLISAQVIVLAIAYVLIQFTLWVNDRNYLNAINSLIFLGVSFVGYIILTLALLKYKRIFIGKKKVIVVTNSTNHDLLMKQINRVTNLFDVIHVFNDNEDINTIIKHGPSIDSFIVDEVNFEVKQELLNYCFFNKKQIIVIPTIEDILIKNGYDVHFIDSPFLVISSFGPRFYERVIKRTIDLLGALILTIIASPILLIVSLSIKIYDGGPILYSQQRLTTNGRIFNVYKFRSMIVDAEKNGAQLAKQNDDRITKVGKILRKYRLDELPQLFNILKGDMSFVGPRPERPSIASDYEKDLPQFKYRLNVKAGLTGYAQVYGRYNTTPKDKLKLDLMYISKYNLLLDIELLFKTVQILFEKESTEGF